tara:strand:+ start:88 stop:363 length:276 start_codon:yes stop_codon:yes gene_type:complete
MRYYIYHYSAKGIVKESGAILNTSGLIKSDKMITRDYTEVTRFVDEQMSENIGGKCEETSIASLSFLGRESWRDFIKRILKTNKRSEGFLC